MWISRQDYKAMQNCCDNCNYKLTEQIVGKPLTALYTNNAIIMSMDLYIKFCDEKTSMDNEKKAMQAELKKYQQMYADEVQKRLKLIERLEK